MRRLLCIFANTSRGRYSPADKKQNMTASSILFCWEEQGHHVLLDYSIQLIGSAIKSEGLYAPS